MQVYDSRITSNQSANGPERQGNMVDQFHVHVHVEPCWRLGEEAVGVDCDVPLTQRSDELGFEACWVKRRQVDTCEYVLARRISESTTSGQVM